MDNELKNINLRRGLIFQDMALVEMTMNNLISVHYLQKLSDVFISEILQNEYFSFELRKRVFMEVYKKRYPGSMFPWEALEKMQKIRNIIAHARLNENSYVDQLTGNKNRVGSVFYTYHTKQQDASDLHEDFKKCMDIVSVALNKIKKDTEIIFSEEMVPEI